MQNSLIPKPMPNPICNQLFFTCKLRFFIDDLIVIEGTKILCLLYLQNKWKKIFKDYIFLN
jgi:hypothetical protein